MIFPSRRQVAAMFAMGVLDGQAEIGRVVAEKCPLQAQEQAKTKTNPHWHDFISSQCRIQVRF